MGRLSWVTRMDPMQSQAFLEVERRGRREAEGFKGTMLPGLKTEEGGHKLRNMGGPLRLETPLEPRRNVLANSLILAQGDPCWTSDLQSSKIIKLHCFKPPSLS